MPFSSAIYQFANSNEQLTKILGGPGHESLAAEVNGPERHATSFRDGIRAGLAMMLDIVLQPVVKLSRVCQRIEWTLALEGGRRAVVIDRQPGHPNTETEKAI